MQKPVTIIVGNTQTLTSIVVDGWTIPLVAVNPTGPAGVVGSSSTLVSTQLQRTRYRAHRVTLSQPSRSRLDQRKHQQHSQWMEIQFH
jgi:hypothetical protein